MMRNIKYILIALLFGAVSQSSAQYLNQAGYLSSSVKRIFLPEEFQGKDYSVINSKGKQVFSGTTNIATYWQASGTQVCFADFSTLKKEGEYTIKVDGCKEEYNFKIDESIYELIGKDVTKMFYHARLSMPIEKKYAGEYARPAGHPDDKVMVHASAASKNRPEGTVISSPGGWYDAGDYNKYIVNSSITTYTMLHAVEQYEAYLNKIELNIPESENSVPDVLDEAIYNLRWMLTMQDPNDGGVYHKLTSKKFCAMVMPHKDKLPRYVVMKSTAAGLDFVSTTAKAARILAYYSDVYPGLAEQCTNAAKNAWAWCERNPNILYKQPTDISTGQYKDSDIKDEWLWAATELYLLTGEKKYRNKINLDGVSFMVPQWRTVATLPLYSILLSDCKDEGLKKQTANKLLKLADKNWKQYNQSPYKVSIVKFPWGSNGDVANQGILFLQAYQLTGKTKYREAADACLGYILGANPTGYCYVTGYGTKSPMHIHERRTESNGIERPLPGFLVGGPTLQAQKDCGKDKYPSSFPARAYLDEECSYSTNEIAINWNAALVGLIWGLDATK